jgi:hypothetical protein
MLVFRIVQVHTKRPEIDTMDRHKMWQCDGHVTCVCTVPVLVV